MALYISLLLLASGIRAQSIGPSNDVLPTQVDQLILKYTSGGMVNVVNVAPLTANIGLGGTQTALNAVHLSGHVKSVDAHSESSLTSQDIAFICCDSNTNSSNISPTEIVQQVVAQPPQGILLYSLIDSHCSLNGSFGYGSILTMTSSKDASFLQGVISSAQSPPTATVQDKTVASNTGSANPTATTDTSNGTPTPTTAVAMSILYSITGIITILFITIIATGAVRAQRHPERYGPRIVSIPGRPRQSRAKGLARAMLETLPIVKFGDPEPAKPGSGDVELEDGVSRANPDMAGKERTKPTDANQSQIDEPEIAMTGVPPLHSSGIGPDIQNSVAASTSKENLAVFGSLGCSICTEDFEKGEDVRVLPCNHKYHPACIDPWLLNVSGTCPLCRIDLRGEAKDPPVEGAENPVSPPLNDTEGPTSAEALPTSDHLVDIINLRDAPASERIAALRILRARQQAAVVGQADTAEQSRRARLTNRLKEKFRIRTQAVAEVPDVGAASSSTAQPDSATATVSSPVGDRT